MTPKETSRFIRRNSAKCWVLSTTTISGSADTRRRQTHRNRKSQLGAEQEMFFERFEAIVRNTTHHTMLTVKSPVRVAQTEVLDPSGQWQRMLTLSSFETADTQAPPCIKVKPRREFTFPNV